MNIFITGGTGFIGKHLVRQLISAGNNVSINLYGDEISPFENTVGTYKFGNGTIIDAIQFFTNEKFDGIIHLASYVQSGNHSSEDIENLIDTNLKFSTIVLETAAQANVKWFINTGTYWQHYNNADYSPVNLYAATKQAFMDIARFYWETDRIFFCTIKLFDTYGPNDTRPKIFTLWERIARTGETLDMSPGEQLIDIAHVDDIVNAFALLASHLHRQHAEVKNGDVFAVKATERYTLIQLAALFEQATNTKLNINWGARPYRNREVMMPWENGVVVPGWKPKVTIEEGIMLTKTIE